MPSSSSPSPSRDRPLLTPLNVDFEPEDEAPTAVPTPTPLPKRQLSILILLLMCEPIVASVIFPFVTQLVGEMDIAKGDKSRVGYYVGLIESLFYSAQALTVLSWGILSDRHGRRPIILFGLFGLALSTLSFGFATRSFALTVLARSLAGFLNGNMGVMKTVLGEITDASNRARAFSLFPVTWIVGSTIGPLIGGALQHPAERFPNSIFGKYPIFRTYPYLLPCAVVVVLLVIFWVLGFLFLKETLAPRTQAKRSGYQALPQDSPTLSTHLSINPDPEGALEDFERNSGIVAESRKPTLRDVLIKPVIFAATNYALLGFIDIALFALMTVFFAVPLSSGGLGYPPPTIALILSLLGILSGTFQLLFFPYLHARFGSRRLLTITFLSFFVLFPLFILMHKLGLAYGAYDWRVWAGVGAMLVVFPLVDMGYSCSFMFVTTSSPSPHHLGTVNGLAQTSVSIVRAIGPATTTSLFALSNEKQWMGGYWVYWFFMCWSVLGLGSVWLLPKSEGDGKRKESRDLTEARE